MLFFVAGLFGFSQLGHPLTICISVTSAIELITGLALRTPAAIQRDREKKLTKMISGPAQLVLTSLRNKNKRIYESHDEELI